MKEWFGNSEIQLDSSNPANDGAMTETEKKSMDAWSSEEIEKYRSLAQDVWRAIRSTPADLVYDRVVQESFPELNPSELHDRANRLFECIAELAQQENPRMTQGITPEQFIRFAHLYLSEKLG